MLIPPALPTRRTRRVSAGESAGVSVARSSCAGSSGVDAHRAHDGVSERSGRCTVEVDVDPDAGGDSVGTAAGLEVALAECAAELFALLAGEAELGGAGGAEASVGVWRGRRRLASGRRA